MGSINRATIASVMMLTFVCRYPVTLKAVRWVSEASTPKSIRTSYVESQLHDTHDAPPTIAAPAGSRADADHVP